MKRRVAVILNRNARGVTESLIAKISRLHDRRDLFVTNSTSEARTAMHTIAKSSYDVVCIGGGDGTFVQAVNDMFALAEYRPILFGLRLGSGNAIADVCGASPPTERGLARDLARAVGSEPPGVLPLLVVGKRLTYSAGFGLDAKYNEDLAKIAKRYSEGWLGVLLRGSRGMFFTATIRTLPRLIRERRPRLRIVAVRGAAYRLDRRGIATGAALPAGSLLYDGEVTIASASTICTFGRGVKFFPFAEDYPGRFQLRISKAGPVGALKGIGRILLGAPESIDGVRDFAIAGARFEFADACPMHLGGNLYYPTGNQTIELSDLVAHILRTPRSLR